MYTINIHICIYIFRVTKTIQNVIVAKHDLSYQIRSDHIISYHVTISIHINTYTYSYPLSSHIQYQIPGRYHTAELIFLFSCIVGLSSDKPAIWWHSACRAELPRLSPWVHRKPVLQPWLDAFHLGSKSSITSSYLRCVGVIHCCIWKWTAGGIHYCSLEMVQLCRKWFIRLVKVASLCQNRDWWVVYQATTFRLQSRRIWRSKSCCFCHLNSSKAN